MRSKTARMIGPVLVGVLLGQVGAILFDRERLALAEPAAGTAGDNPELAALFAADQAERMPPDGQQIDWEVLLPLDRQRQARVKELYEQGELKSAKDYYHAAMVLQHADRPDDYLLAHEFCIVAVAKGDRNALWLAAATEDRFLMTIKRPQRFGTQYRTVGLTGPAKLYEVGAGVTDALRRELMVPTLDEARAREAEFEQLFRQSQDSLQKK